MDNNFSVEATTMRWVSAESRLPTLSGKEHKVVIRYKNHVTYGWRNFDIQNPEMYFVIGHDSFLTNEGVIWLDEEDVKIESSMKVKVTAHKKTI